MGVRLRVDPVEDGIQVQENGDRLYSWLRTQILAGQYDSQGDDEIGKV